MLRRLFEVKIAYKSVKPLTPESAVQITLSPAILEGFKALDDLFYEDVDSYMKAADVDAVTMQLSPSKHFNQHLTAGFEALDREFYGILATYDDDDTSRSNVNSASESPSTREFLAHGSGKGDEDTACESAVKVKPENALLELLGNSIESSAVEDGPLPKRPCRVEAEDAMKQSLQSQQRKKKKK